MWDKPFAGCQLGTQCLPAHWDTFGSGTERKISWREAALLCILTRRFVIGGFLQSAMRTTKLCNEAPE